MDLKLVVALFALTSMPAFAQVPIGRPAASAPKLTKADVQKVVQTISGDKTKMRAYCDLAKLNQQIAQADQKRDTSQIIGQKAEDLAQKLGPDYVKLMDGLDQVDDNSGEAEEIAARLDEITASFDDITAALMSLDKQCK
jgi:uncharacterized coiled-coil DUF342 family protein